MDHKAFLATLSPQTRAALQSRRLMPGVRHLALHAGAIMAVGALIVALPVLRPVLVPVQGVLVIFLFTLLHETSHRTVFPSDQMNDRVGRAAGFLVFTPAEWFRWYHLAHHRHTNDPERDPELEGGKPETWRAYLWHVSGIPTWCGSLATLWRNATGREAAPWMPERQRPAVRREARVMLGLYAGVLALIAAGQTWIAWTWLVPIIVGQPILRLYLLAEHGRCPAVANMLENSRTTLTNRAVRWLAWNMPYHAEHHAFPTVPFHRLPELHALTRAHLRSVSPGYGAFHAEYAGALSR